MSWQQRIEQALAERQQAAAYRHRQANQGSNSRHLYLDNKSYLNFSSNDYLGISQRSEVITAWQRGAERYGVGSGGSGHMTGFSEAHDQLEQQLAAWLGYPRALLFISGYAANQAVLTALMQKDDRILADKLSHASLLEAATHSPALLRRFRHNQPQVLAALLQKSELQKSELQKNKLQKGSSGNQLVVTEGVFSMDGDSAPLAELHRLAQHAGAWLMVDDAHGIGVCGEQGRGSCWQQGVQPEILVITFGKAFGVSGAAVLCSEPLAEYLLQFARHLIYSTAMPAAQACALLAALHCIQQGNALREQLQAHIQHFRAGVSDLPLTLTPSSTAIQPLLVGDNQRALVLAQGLRERGIWATAIRPPTVPPGGARLRITLTAAHQAQDIDYLLEELHDLCR